MSDEINNESWSASGTGETAGGAAQAPPATVGYCQDCGKPLTDETVRGVGNSLFCEPCLTTRVGSQTTSYGSAPVPGEPRPALAALLGFIPGVGAMYNGQYAKGIVHFVVFVILVSLANDVNNIFGLFVMGWIFYMAFEAYHTASARRDGMPLPNPFGLNDIGERMGFGRTWGPVANGNTARPPVTPPASAPPAGYAPVGRGSGWVGYVPPTAFAGAPPVPPVDPSAAAAAQQAPAWGHAPSAQTYPGGTPPATPSYVTVPPVAPIPPLPPTRRLPVGAFWLIGLGLLILLTNLLPDWHVGEHWWPPILFAGLSVWLFTRRLGAGVPVVGILRWPVILMALAVMFALHAADFHVTFGLTFAVLLIVIGGLLLIERAAAEAPIYAPPVSVVPPVSEEEAERARAAWAAGSTEAAQAERPVATEWDPAKDSQKEGQ